VLEEYIRDTLEKRLIRELKSPVGYPILFVPKKDRTLRLYIDYRKLNNITVKNRYPLLLINELLDRLANAKVFLKIDLKNIYYRIRIREGDEWKIAFRIKFEHYEYLIILFSLTNTPAIF